MSNDAPFWIALGGRSSIYCAGGIELLIATGVLCFGVAFQYLIIAIDWKRREAKCTSARGKAALRDLRIIFIWCAVSGYVFRIALIAYPVWSLYLLSLAWLNYITWRYIRSIRSLNIVYSDAEKLEQVLDRLRYSEIADPQKRMEAIQTDLIKHLEHYK